EFPQAFRFCVGTKFSDRCSRAPNLSLHVAPPLASYRTGLFALGGRSAQVARKLALHALSSKPCRNTLRRAVKVALRTRHCLGIRLLRRDCGFDEVVQRRNAVPRLNWKGSP